ncbi:hypothetical protein FFI97_027290 [Variovorax sp. KBS0712]|nr:hypothetical protein FFI97_027290 [Variovorax sp. KBS0712]
MHTSIDHEAHANCKPATGIRESFSTQSADSKHLTCRMGGGPSLGASVCAQPYRVELVFAPYRFHSYGAKSLADWAVRPLNGFAIAITEEKGDPAATPDHNILPSSSAKELGGDVCDWA